MIQAPQNASVVAFCKRQHSEAFVMRVKSSKQTIAVRGKPYNNC